MGLPVARLIVGSNRNDILTRFLTSNDMSIGPVEPSLSPSMDIQVSSNFERLLFELLDRDAGNTTAKWRSSAVAGRMEVPDPTWHRCRHLFHGFRLDDPGTEPEIAGCTRFAAISPIRTPRSALLPRRQIRPVMARRR